MRTRLQRRQHKRRSKSLQVPWAVNVKGLAIPERRKCTSSASRSESFSGWFRIGSQLGWKWRHWRLNGQKFQPALDTQAVISKKQILMCECEIVGFEKIVEGFFIRF